MTRDEDTPLPGPNEAPHHVRTPLGTAVVSFVAVAFGVQIADQSARCDVTIRGDRIVLRSAIDNQPHTYAVFERATESGGRWRGVTNDLAATELVNWNDHRRDAGDRPAGAFEVWLDRVADSRSSHTDASETDSAAP
jgi:hypothetical protein